VELRLSPSCDGLMPRQKARHSQSVPALLATVPLQRCAWRNPCNYGKRPQLHSRTRAGCSAMVKQEKVFVDAFAFALAYY
jgi:hypothetical protein